MLSTSQRNPAVALPGLLAIFFIAGCGLGFAASTVTSTVTLSENRAEAAAIAKMQQTHPGQSWSVTLARFHPVSTRVSDSAGQTLSSSWIPCFASARSGPLGLLTCPPPAVWAIELTTPSKERKALVVVEAQSGVVQAVLIHRTASSSFDSPLGCCQMALSARAAAPPK